MPARWTLKLCVPCRTPPANMEIPSANSRLPTIEPTIDDLTTLTSPCRSAKNPMMISGVLPSEAVKSPPHVAPR